MPVRYGLYDTVDNLWLGDDNGPKTFAEGDILPWDPERALTAEEALFFARCAAEAACHVVEWPPTRVRAREIDITTWKIKDEVVKTRTELDWVIRKERGSIP